MDLKEDGMKNPNRSLLYWLPRILSILFILFIMMFSLDVFDGKSSFGDILIGLFMHNLPAFGIMVITFFAWRNDLVGAIGFGGIGLALIILVNIAMSGDPDSVGSYAVSGPAFVIGVLYLVNWFKTRNKTHS